MRSTWSKASTVTENSTFCSDKTMMAVIKSRKKIFLTNGWQTVMTLSNSSTQSYQMIEKFATFSPISHHTASISVHSIISTLNVIKSLHTCQCGMSVAVKAFMYFVWVHSIQTDCLFVCCQLKSFHLINWRKLIAV